MIAEKDCKVIFIRKGNDVSVEIIELEKTRMFGHLINGILEMTTNELVCKMLNNSSMKLDGKYFQVVSDDFKIYDK